MQIRFYKWAALGFLYWCLCRVDMTVLIKFQTPIFFALWPGPERVKYEGVLL